MQLDVNRHGCGEQLQAPAQNDELPADPPDCLAVGLAELGNGLVIGGEPSGEPDHIDIALALALQAAAGLHAVEVTVNLELQQHRRMIGRASGRQRIDPWEPQIAQIQRFDKDVNDPHRVVLGDEVF